MAWGDLRETSAVMSAVKGRHDDFAGGTVSNNNIFKNGEEGNAWVVGCDAWVRGKRQKQIQVWPQELE